VKNNNLRLYQKIESDTSTFSFCKFDRNYGTKLEIIFVLVRRCHWFCSVEVWFWSEM